MHWILLEEPQNIIPPGIAAKRGLSWLCSLHLACSTTTGSTCLFGDWWNLEVD